MKALLTIIRDTDFIDVDQAYDITKSAFLLENPNERICVFHALYYKIDRQGEAAIKEAMMEQVKRKVTDTLNAI